MGEVARRAGGGKKVPGRESRVAGLETPLPATPYSPQIPSLRSVKGGDLETGRCKVLPREWSDLGVGWPPGPEGVKDKPRECGTNPDRGEYYPSHYGIL